MGRLIDADALMEEIKSLRVTVTGLRAGKDIRTELYRESVLRTIDEQPTAYDKDKVKEQLEEFMEEAEQFHVSGMVADMIDVVERGGVE